MNSTRRFMSAALKASFATMPRVAMEAFNEEVAEGIDLDAQGVPLEEQFQSPEQQVDAAIDEHRMEIGEDLTSVEAALEAFQDQPMDSAATQFLSITLHANAKRAGYEGVTDLSEIQGVDPKMVAVEARRIVGEIRELIQA